MSIDREHLLLDAEALVRLLKREHPPLDVIKQLVQFMQNRAERL